MGENGPLSWNVALPLRYVPPITRLSSRGAKPLEKNWPTPKAVGPVVPFKLTSAKLFVK